MTIKRIRVITIDGLPYNVERSLLRSIPDGEHYIAESFPDGTVRAACGPLQSSEVRAADLWTYELDIDIGQWIQERTEQEDNQPTFAYVDIEKYEADHATPTD